MMKNSPYTDIELLEIASGFKKHLKNHFSTIKNFNPGLNEDFIIRFKALYYEVQSKHPVELEADSIARDYINDLSNLADQVKKSIMIFRFYMQKAFPYDSTLWKPYEYCEFEMAINDYSKLCECLGTSVKIINEKRPELRAVDCPATILEEIETLSKQINDKYEEMLNYLEKKARINDAYIANLNDLFKLMKMVHDAALKCFQNDPESLKLLTFPSKRTVS